MSMSPHTTPSLDTPNGPFPDLDSSLQSFSAGFDPGHVLSPSLHNGQFHFQVPHFGDSQSPASVAMHRMSVGSSAALQAQPQDSDPASPSSVRGQNTSASAIPDDQKDSKGDPIPAWAELKTKAGKERKRLPLACIACRRKKIRCSGEKPACKHCLRSRIPCVYKVTTRKAAPRTDYMAMLDKRLKRMEERVIRIVPKEDQGRISVIGRAVVKPAIPGLPAKPANEKKRPADTAFSEELNDWSKTKSVNSAQTRAGKTASDDQDEHRLLQEGAESLPPHDLQLHLAEVYFDFVYGQSYHLLHKPSFMRKLQVGQVPPVLILAVCAISARFSSHPDVRTEPAFLRGEKWASAAREIALKRYDSPNITILIVYLILGLHEFGTCQGGRSWMLGGMAQRMAYALQLHKDLDHDTTGRGKPENPELSFTDREIRRRTMWSCFMMDRFNSSGTERPIFVSEQFIQSQLPVKEHLFQFEIPGVTETLEGPISGEIERDATHAISATENMGVAAFMIRLVSIWGRVIRYMNLGGRERDKDPMWSPQSEFHAIRKALRDWQSSLPSWLYRTQENLENHASEKIANQFIFMHLIYNQIILFLNRFALPTPGSRSANLRDTPQAFIAECGRAALDAANQVSSLVTEAMDHRVVAPFAGYCAFFSSTVHIYGVFSKNAALEASSKQNLTINIKYLTRLKKYWGMMHFVTENLKDLYRKHADAAIRGPQTGAAPNGQKSQETIFQYGDWFDRYPHGVSGTDYEEPITAEVKKEPGSDAVLGKKNDLQSVEEFFSKLSPPARAAQKKTARKKKNKAEVQPARSAQAAAPPPLPPPTTTTTTVAASAGSQSTSSPQVQQPTQNQPQQMLQIKRPTATVSQMGSGSLNPNFAAIASQPQQNFSPEMAMMQAQHQQQQQQHPQHPQRQQSDHHQYQDMMAGLTHDMSIPPYNMPNAPSNLDHNNGGNMTGMDMRANPFNIDLNAFDFGGGGNHNDDNSTPWGDQTSAWFMPFNMEPPASTMTDDTGLFSADPGFDVNGLFPDLASFGGAGPPGLMIPGEHGFEDTRMEGPRGEG